MWLAWCAHTVPGHPQEESIAIDDSTLAYICYTVVYMVRAWFSTLDLYLQTITGRWKLTQLTERKQPLPLLMLSINFVLHPEMHREHFNI